MRETGAVYGGVRTRTIEIAGTGPTLILLHGYSDSADTWKPLMRELRERGRHAIAVDMRGFGQADPFEPGEMLPQLDAFVAAVVREHAPNNGKHPGPVIVGNSLGGVAAFRAAQNRSLPISGVIPISPAGLGHQPWVTLAEREPVIHRILTAPTPVPMRAVRAAVTVAYGRLAVHDRSRADPEAAAAYAAQYRSRDDINRFIRGARTILGEIRDPYELAEISCPVMMIWGDRDLLTPIRGSKHVFDALPHAELHTLERVGHCAQVEVAARVAELVTGFADRVGVVRKRSVKVPGRSRAAKS
jgi:pimeloyl-ACP methyl ester carboxylesterase